MTDQSQTQPQTVQPSPVPTTFQVAAVTDNNTGLKFTLLSVSTATGKSVFFLDSSTAKAVAETLLKSAEATAESGLVVAQSLPQ